MGRLGIPIQVRREFWQQVRNGLPIFKAAQAVGVPVTTAQTWHRQAGGVNPYLPKPVFDRYLSFKERKEIAVGLAAGRSQVDIARQLVRCPSSISREIARNSCKRTFCAPSVADINAQKTVINFTSLTPRASHR
jgi:hypothetical protein